MKLNIHNVELLISAVKKEQYPPTGIPEIALIGRSNVGKSSLINKILNRNNFARVSATPGKTVTVNFYSVDNGLMIVDLPGYGYAAGTKDGRKKLTGVIGEYLSERRQLMQLVVLVDSRHKPTADDIQMVKNVKAGGCQAVVIATKADKLSKTKLNENLEMICDTLDLTEGDILIPFTVKDTQGAEAFWDYISDYILPEEEE